MDKQHETIVILGAGHSGVSAASFLRQNGWPGSIHLISEEDRLPYQRPPLSKGWLKGDVSATDLELRSDKFYREQRVEIHLNASPEIIVRKRKTVVLKDGREFPYTYLIAALGARARNLGIPGSDLKNVFELRSVVDAEKLKTMLRPGARIIIIGGGYIGLEVAATAIALGAHPTIVERENRVLSRCASVELSAFIEREHRNRGVAVECDANVKAILEYDGSAATVQLENGREISCDIVLIGTGVRPNDDLARVAGLICEDGIVVDNESKTTDPHVYAIGDCSTRPLPHGGFGRLESVPNAVEQAKQAAASICGQKLPKLEVPWFWSDQFNFKVQMAGTLAGAPEAVIRTNGAENFSVFHLSADRRLQAVETVNAPREFMAGKQLIAKGQPITAEQLQSNSITNEAAA